MKFSEFLSTTVIIACAVESVASHRDNSENIELLESVNGILNDLQELEQEMNFYENVGSALVGETCQGFDESTGSAYPDCAFGLFCAPLEGGVGGIPGAGNQCVKVADVGERAGALLSSVAVANSSSKAIAVRNHQSYDVDVRSFTCETGKASLGLSIAVVGAVASLIAAPVTGGASVAVYVGAMSAVSGSLLGFYTCEGDKNLIAISSLMENVARAIYKEEAYDDAQGTAASWFTRIKRFPPETASIANLDSLISEGYVALNEAKEAPIQGAFLTSLITEELAVLLLTRITKAKTGDDWHPNDRDHCDGHVKDYFETLKSTIDFLEKAKREREEAFYTGILGSCNIVISNLGAPCEWDDLLWERKINYRAEWKSTDQMGGNPIKERVEKCVDMDKHYYRKVNEERDIRVEVTKRALTDYKPRITAWWNVVEPQLDRLYEMYNQDRSKTLSLCGTF